MIKFNIINKLSKKTGSTCDDGWNMFDIKKWGNELSKKEANTQ